MIYDLSEPIFNNVPQWPKFRPSSMTVSHPTATEAANVDRLELITHTGTHIDARFQFFPDGDTVGHFASFPVLIEGAGGAWTRAVAWDDGDLA
jgi:kynurenine formamidase